MQPNRIRSKDRMIPIQKSSSPLGSLVGSVVGGAMGAALGPLGVAAGSTIGSSLGGSGDLSGVTPEALAMNALTAGMPVPGGEAAKGATEAAKGAATETAKVGATGSLNTLGTNVADNAVKAAGGFDAAGAMSGIQDQLASVGADSASMATSATNAAKTGPLSGLSKVFNPTAAQVQSAASNGLIKNPTTMLAHGINVGTGAIKDAFKNSTMFKADGGPVPAQHHVIEHKRKLHDLEKAQMILPMLGMLTGGGVLGQTANAMNLAKGGKACNCGPLVSCDCDKE